MIITDGLNGIIVTLEVVLQLFRGGGDYTQVIIGSTFLFQKILQIKYSVVLCHFRYVDE